MKLDGWRRNFGIFLINLKPGKIDVLCDSLSRIPNVLISKDKPSVLVTSVEVPEMDMEQMSPGYDTDRFCKRIRQALKEKWPDNVREKNMLERILPMFEEKDDVIRYAGRLYAPRKNVSKVLDAAHDLKVSQHFGVTKTLSRLSSFYWKYMSRGVKQYVRGCMKCQQYKDSRAKSLGDPNPLEVPHRRWGLVATDFIVVQLPKSKDRFDAITTRVDRLSSRVQFVRVYKCRPCF